MRAGGGLPDNPDGSPVRVALQARAWTMWRLCEQAD